MVFALVVALSFGPALLYASVVYWLDRFEKEPLRLLIGAFLWGAIIATVGAIIATNVLQISLEIITRNPALAELTGTTLIAPLVEESLKGAAVLLIFLIFPHEFDSVLDGIVYAAITALGFAATENVLYLYFQGYATDGASGLAVLFVLRVLLGGWGHAVYTSFIGIGLAVARLRRGWAIKIIAPVLGWCVAVFLHALHNTMATILGSSLGLGGLLATLLVDWTGWAMALGLVIWAIFRERRWMLTYLREEVELGVISAEQYRTACSIRAQLTARARSRASRLFYAACAELAQKKHHLATLGEERGNTARVMALRAGLASQSALV
ncbi:PrsW family intramembrane metalloprotease [Oscillochloris sp. ZM17-4]|uniref:PrsW family intramembrane metalloprotease n=1 Tax=Oscillochloris sp. ZM17-4 TaxID=2866714 RepID=UPI001C7356B7|nr:PrsW family intramembrane metalloprotease [Oscillochloris sp. ZM17-4]MBX0329865.1 PrsW family intramembrane metalloprotease [Oscillochloris sp. ZM17-4]